MTTIVSAELLKLRTTRAPWLTGAAVAVLAGGILTANAVLVGQPGQPAAVPAVLGELVRAPGRLTGAAALLLGLLLTTTEYRHATALTTRLAHPRVPSLVLAKAGAAALVGALLAVIVEVVMLAGGAALLAARDVAVEPVRHGIPASVAAIVVVTALHAAAGVGLGELVRNPALAVGAAFGWAFVVEGVLPVVFREPGLDRWLPTGAARSALALGLPADAAALPAVAGVALLAGYAAALVLAGLVRSHRTDP